MAIVTPMNKEGAIDFDSFTKLLKFHEDSGTDGIVLVGTTGESATLNKIEREEIFKFAKNATNIPLMAGIGSSSTSEACELADMALKNNIKEKSSNSKGREHIGVNLRRESIRELIIRRFL